MASEWQPLVLGKVCTKIGSGATPRGGKESYRGGATTLIRSQNIYNDHFVHDGIAYIDDTQADELRNVVVEPDDVLLNITGDSVARCCQVVPDVLPARVNQHVAIVRPKADVLDARFLRYSLVSPSMQAQLMALASAGATRNALTKGMIEALVVHAPPLQEQRAIAETLGALDDRIDNLRQTNATLQAIAAALFKSWFVDFDGVPQVDMQESELGLIPKGWRVAPAGEIYEVGIGKTPPRKEQHWFTEDAIDVPWVSIKDMGDSGLFVGATSEHLTREAVEKFNIRRVPAETVLLSFKLTVGRLAMTDTEMTTNEAIAHFKHKAESLPQSFLYCYLKQYDFSQLGSTSSIATATNSKAIRELPILHPSCDLVEKFDAIVSPMFQQIRKQQQQTRTLATLRDTLLSRLTSGRLRIADTNRHIVEVTA